MGGCRALARAGRPLGVERGELSRDGQGVSCRSKGKVGSLARKACIQGANIVVGLIPSS